MCICYGKPWVRRDFNSNSDSWRAPPSTLEIASNASIASTASKKDKGPRPNDPSLKQSHCFGAIWMLLLLLLLKKCFYCFSVFLEAVEGSSVFRSSRDHPWNTPHRNRSPPNMLVFTEITHISFSPFIYSSTQVFLPLVFIKLVKWNDWFES